MLLVFNRFISNFKLVIPFIRSSEFFFYWAAYYHAFRSPRKHTKKPTSPRFQQLYKRQKTTHQVLLGKFATLVQTTKYGVLLPYYCRAVKEQVFSRFLLNVTHSTERILPKDTDFVKILPQTRLKPPPSLMFNVNPFLVPKGLTSRNAPNTAKVPSYWTMSPS
ncbi:hypothetical protein J6590_048503 [Homalodisca vitripennis]|nr:hypothetical protein J6590_048503 [Homalodisca vitripennis]